MVDVGPRPRHALPFHHRRRASGVHRGERSLANFRHHHRHEVCARRKVRQHGAPRRGFRRRFMVCAGERRDQRRHTGIEFHMRQGAAIAVATVITQEAAAQRRGGSALMRRHHGGVGRVTGTVNLLAVPLHKLAAHPLGHIGRLKLDGAPVDLRRDGRVTRRLVGIARDGALLQHPAQHEIAPFQRPLGTVDGVARIGPLDDAGEHRQLREIELGKRLVVVSVGRRLGAIGAFAEEQHVDVELKHLFLAELLLDLDRQQHLLELANERLFQRERDVARQLHGDGGRAGAHIRVQQNADDVVRERDVVDATVFVEALVLGVQQRVREVFRHVLEGHRNEAALAKLGHEGAVVGKHPHRRLRAIVQIGFRCRHLWLQIQVGAGHAQRHHTKGATNEPTHGLRPLRHAPPPTRRQAPRRGPTPQVGYAFLRA